MSLYNELKRRNVIRMAVAYLIGGCLLIALASQLFPALGIPEGGVRLLAVVCTLGFLPALMIAWSYELTPEGIVRDVPIARSSVKRLDVITICLAIAALVIILVNMIWFNTGQDVPVTITESEVVSARGHDMAVRQYSPNSIAVLPLVNMSDDAANEYFSDGISEGLLDLLSRVRELRVISRSSAFSFKGKDADIPTIAEQLKVAYILEGSVRKTGNMVRITVQLIDTASDTPLWSDTYDRTLDDIFFIQDDIARTVVKQLKITLLNGAPNSEEIKPEAYTVYLQARHVGNLFTAEAFEQSIALYKQALAVEPGYAAAWAGLAAIYINQTTTGHRPADVGTRLAREAAWQALALDPGQAPAHAYLSILALRYDRDLEAAARHLRNALELEPANPDILSKAATLYRSLNRLEEAIAVDEYVVDRDPVNPVGHYFLGFSYFLAGHLEGAIASFRKALMLSPEHVSAHYRIGQALALKGNWQAALMEMQLEPRPTKRLMGEVMVYHALGQTGKSDTALNELIDKYQYTTAYNIAYLLAFRGENDRAFTWLDKAAQYRDSGLIQIAVQPEFKNIHTDPRWLPFLARIGMSEPQLAAIEFDVTLPD